MLLLWNGYFVVFLVGLFYAFGRECVEQSEKVLSYDKCGDELKTVCKHHTPLKSSRCKVYVMKYRQVKDRDGSWWKKTRYKKESYYEPKSVCCNGFSGPKCLATCHGSTELHSCNRREGSIRQKDGSVTNCSGGICVGNNKCVKCNEGYYASDDGYCRACTEIKKCDLPLCTTKYDSKCQRCSGEVNCNTSGLYAYTKTPDPKQCQRACSWKQGARCYPGNCSANTSMILATNCICAAGYINHGDCDTFDPGANETLKPTVLKFEAILNKTNHTGLILDYSNETKGVKIWSNVEDWLNLEMEMQSAYTAPETDPPPYIVCNKTRIGVKAVRIEAVLRRESKVATWQISNDTCNNVTNCRLNVSKKPLKNSEWSGILGNDHPTFHHLDNLTFTAFVENGGIVTYNDWDNQNGRFHYKVEKHYYIKGIEVNRTIEAGIDLLDPTHCAEMSTPCSTQPLVVKDFFDLPSIDVTWSGWQDDDSGVREYVIDIFALKVKNLSAEDPHLEPEAELSFNTVVSASQNTTTVNFTHAGPYFVELIVNDWAGNHKSTRRLCLFDDNSTVELTGDSPNVTLATPETGAEWINKKFDDLTLLWPNRFINIKHHVNRWLNAVDYMPSISRELDDIAGKSLRTTERLHNIQGVVRVDVRYQIDPGFGQPLQTNDFINVSRVAFDAQQLLVQETSKDGDKYIFDIRGYDAIGKYAEDTYRVKVDTSPPVITYLWLTKGDIVNVSVHDVIEFKELTIEWEVYDEHSGIHEIAWRLFANYTGDVISHGNAHETPQGNTSTLGDCEKEYSLAARGPQCYCTPFDGCYHRHYQVKPTVTNTGSDGLHGGKHIGIHEGDYFIEVVAINRARLKTKREFKITIDTSPPHMGSVHDGLKGVEEVDFQQSLSLRSHWDDFFDKESGVWFYLYKYGTECVPNEEFDLPWTGYHNFTRTYNAEGHFEAPEPGTYYATVAAYNHAFDHSFPVCSDGVTVDAIPAEASEVVVRGALTKPGLMKTEDGEVFFLHRDRTIQKIANPTQNCINKAAPSTKSEISMIPERRNIRGEKVKCNITTPACDNEGSREDQLVSFLISDSHLDISWNMSSTPSGIHNYEVGLASEAGTNPDKMNFLSSKHHQRIRLIYPNVWNGDEFHIVLRTLTKSNTENIQFIGPFIVCKTVPTFTGKVTVDLERQPGTNYLIVNWGSGSFECDCDPYSLYLEVGVGSDSSHDNVLPFKPLSPGGTCTDGLKCTAINVQTLPWGIHGYRKYYVIIKATNVVGNFVLVPSDPYIHNVDLASEGVVFDIDKDSKLTFDDTEDIDFQVETTKLTAKWSGFEHPFLNINYLLCVRERGSKSYLKCENAGTDRHHTLTGLTLEKHKTYIQVVIAETNYGNVSASSDGVIIFEDGSFLDNVVIRDGSGLQFQTIITRSGDLHHDSERMLSAIDDIEYQRSTTELHAHWNIPADIKYLTSDIYWSVEERANFAEHWDTIIEHTHHRFTKNISVHNLFLQAGRKYRFSITFCAEKFCFQPLKSNGVMIIPNPPITGVIGVDFNNGTNIIEVEMGRFYDHDIPNFEESVEVMDHYEWTIADNSHHGNIVFKWSEVTIDRTDSNTLWFAEVLGKTILFTKCWRISVRGYTKAGLYSTVSSDIKNCTDVQKVRPHLVIDATGVPVLSKGSTETIHEGQPITLAQNAYWLDDDKDYTTYNNVISAVWPSLKYKSYMWAVIEVQPTDPVLYYNTSHLALSEPCSHPDTIACGQTEDEYMNAMFKENIIIHGRRYVVCIHANATVHVFEEWIQELTEISVCSNGITVDLTPPIPSDVWIGNTFGQEYQTTTSDMSVNWKSFKDVEEEGNGVHQSGIAKYEVAIGSSFNGVDVVDFIGVGVTNYVSFHSLRLQNGHTYFATVKATDFTGQQSKRTSASIKVDTTPPVLTGNSLTLKNRYITSKSTVYSCWTGVFIDNESGLSHFEWGVGSHPGYDDIYTFSITDQECEENSLDKPLELLEGHAYFVTVKAHNKAGLIRIASSWAFTVDASPPAKGHVNDGPRDAEGNLNDIDYVTDTTVIAAHWTEFYDHQSPVVDYYISAGTCFRCMDVLERQPIGIVHDLRLNMLHLMEGVHYFVSITACNSAGMCSSASSDGFIVDKSPPIGGRVLDGVEGRDIQYQASRLHLGAEWYGFIDPQSGISHYVWRVGTRMYGDDILNARNVHHQQESFIIDYQLLFGQMLPVGVKLYSTVRAYNRAGMYTELCSNGVIIDDSASIFVLPLSLSNIGTVVNNTSVLRSVLKVEWDVKDEESFIEEQYLSISSHIGGDFNLSSTKVEGIVRDNTFTGLHLHDGSYYDVHLTVCNGAKQCMDSSVTNILVDSSSPTPGMFAIDTDHAANLLRQPDGWMTWTPIGLRLAWIGFEDIHSGIDRYMINIGSSFLNDDLNMTPGAPISIPHSDKGEVYDEGTVQVLHVGTKTLTKDTRVFISMWAVNKVGLPSQILHGEFELLFGTNMSLVRRCVAHTCYGHCVCAPHGETCESDTMCNDTSKDNENFLLEVKLGPDIKLSNGQTLIYYPINSMMEARWSVLKEQGKLPKWYEWSVGESQYDQPKGVYNEAVERVWHDAGRNTSWIVTLNEEHHILTESLKYCFFVRVWYDVNSYAIYKSNSVMIYTRPPSPIPIGNKSVKEVVYGTKLDTDYFDRNTQVFIDWDGKFYDNEGSLHKYHVYISSSKGGHDMHVLGVNLPTSVTKVNITGLHFENHTRYYSVVQAYNKAGLHTTECSDGFTIDVLPLYTGVVYDGKGPTDTVAINSSETLTAFWFGFTDSESSIKNYETCISTLTNSRCNIKTWDSVGLSTKSAYINTKYLSDGSVVYHHIRAIDGTGHRSRSVRSAGIIIDRTPPVRSYTLRYDNNMLANPSFERNENHVMLESFNGYHSCDDVLESWILGVDSCLVHESSSIGVSPEGLKFLVLSGSISQDIANVPPGKYKLSFYTSHVLNNPRAELSSAEGYVDFMGQRWVFLVHNKPSLIKEEIIDSHALVSWQEHQYYFHITEEVNATVTIGTAKKSSHIAIDNIQLEARLVNDDNVPVDDSGHVDAKPVFTNDWSSIHAEWNFVDEESPIVEYFWAVGTVEGGTQLQDFKTVGRQTFAYAYDLHLVHNTVLYITVIAVNRAGLRTVSNSDPVIIDKTPPVFLGIYDGSTPGKDIDAQRSKEITVSWTVDDPESNVKRCQWAIGAMAGDTSIQNFTDVPKDKSFASVVLHDVPLTPIYVTVKCTNNAGLSTTLSTDGVLIKTTAPSVDSVFIDVLGESQTQYTVRDGYHADPTFIKFRWTGFHDGDEIDSYLVGIEGPQIAKEELVQSSTSSFSYASFTNLTLVDGTYKVYVTAINKVQLYSQRVTKEVVLLTKPPKLTGASMETTWDLPSKTFGVTWPGVFTSPYPMYFEVTAKLDEAEGDLIQWQETTNTELFVTLDTDKVSKNTGVVRVTVRAISYCGLFSVARTETSVVFN